MPIKQLSSALTITFAALLIVFAPPRAASTVAGMQKGKPTPPPQPSSYSGALGPSIYDDPDSLGTEEDYPDASRDGLKPAGYLSLPTGDFTGAITGPNKNGNFIGAIGGPITGLVITGVAELPDWYDGGNPCQENEVSQLTNLGLVGSALSGNLTWTFSELGGSLKGNPRIDWQLEGVVDSQGMTWSLAGHSGGLRAQFFPLFEPASTADNLTVTVEGSVVDFIGPSMSVLQCRADFTMTLIKTAPGTLER